VAALTENAFVKARWVKKPGQSRAPSKDREAKSEDPQDVIRCTRCGHVLTRANCRIEVEGLHEHGQVNPHGYIWHFRCYSEAPGCRPVGTTSAEFSWFSGALWQILHCANCDLHLGWEWSGPGARRFVGLILERIFEDSG
jgi:hypothetical protein